MTDIAKIFGGAPATTFMGLPSARLDALVADVAVLGAPAATPYAATGPYCAEAPAAVRKAVAHYANALQHMDLDLGGPLAGDAHARIVDCGDLPWHVSDFAANRDTIRAAIAAILDARAVPVVLGGDDSVPIPILDAYQQHGPLTILQIDAHIDWRDEVQGERLGLSSNMRRASEMPWVERIVQVGARAIGSARPADYEDAVKWGVKFVLARELHRTGVAAALETIPPGARVYINLDVDGLDPSVMPAVIGRSPGGLSFWQATELLHGVASKATIAGFSIVELTPARDTDGLSALTAARLVANAIGLTARAVRR